MKCIICSINKINFNYRGNHYIFIKSQEMQDLENQFRTKRKLMVDDALSKLHEKYDKLRDSLAKQHQEELAALQVN